MTKSVRLKNTLAVHVLTHKIVEDLVTFIQHLPNYLELKCDCELTRNLARQVDAIIQDDKTLTAKQKESISKAELILEAMIKSFELVESEIPQIKSQLEFLINNKLIKKRSFLRLFSSVSKLLGKFV